MFLPPTFLFTHLMCIADKFICYSEEFFFTCGFFPSFSSSICTHSYQLGM